MGQDEDAHRATIARMRIAQVNDIAHVGSTLASALRDLGQEVDLLESPRPFPRGPVLARRLALPARAWGLVATGLRVRFARYDIVHVHFARLGVVGPLAGRPFVLHCHGTDVRGLATSRWRPLVVPLLRRAAVVYYATPDLGDDILPVRPDATFLPNPIDTALFAPVAAGQPPSASPRDLLVGVRLDPIKGSARIRAALEAVLDRRPETSVTVIDAGAGAPELRSLRGDVRFVAPVPHEALPGLLRSHRVALGQLQVGSIGNYELEAMAAGIPVVTHFRHEAAYSEPPPIAEAGDAEEAAGRIIGLVDDERARVELARTARAWVERHHAAPGIAGRVLAAYRTIVGAGG